MGTRSAIDQHAQGQPTERVGPVEVVNGPRQIDSPWLTTEEAADRLRYVGPARLRSVYRFIKANGIAVRRRSVRSILIAKADIDRALIGRKAR